MCLSNYFYVLNYQAYAALAVSRFGLLCVLHILPWGVGLEEVQVKILNHQSCMIACLKW